MTNYRDDFWFRWTMVFSAVILVLVTILWRRVVS